MTTMAIHITGDADADQVLTDSPFALLVGMMLDQQYPMEHAFRGPAQGARPVRVDRAGAIAAADPEEFAALCSTPPAIHRFAGSMAARLQALAAHRRGRVRRPRRADLDRGGRRPGAARADAGAARLRQAEGADLRGAAGQAARRTPRGLGGRPSARTPRTATARSPTSSTRRRLQKVRDFKKEKKAEAKAQAV